MRKGVLSCCLTAVVCGLLAGAAGCGDDESVTPESRTVPHAGQWGVYVLDPASQDVSLLYSTGDEISEICLSRSGTKPALAIKTESATLLDTTAEIYVLDLAGGDLRQLTDNTYFDAYPSFSPNDSEIAFLSMRGSTLDLYVMNADGTDARRLYNSGGHDGDVDWGSQGRIAFTRDYQIWTIAADGTDPTQVTDPANAGVWGAANLPIGDYDPKISPDGSRIVFERMVEVAYPHGGYDIFVTGIDENGEVGLTNNGTLGWAQGLPCWSHAGDKLVYVVTAVGSEGKYDLYMMNADGSQSRDITPGYFPASFLCHSAVFSSDDSKLYFIGQWWQ